MGKALIIDDNPGVGKTLLAIVEDMGHEADSVQTLNEGLGRLRSQSFDVVLLDVHMPDGNGLDFLPTIRALDRSPQVIIITGKGDPNGAELAIRNGAWDYLQKPLSPSKILLPLKRVFQYCQTVQDSPLPAIALKLDGIIGRSRLMQSCFDALAQAAGSKANVFIKGETGTGKELFARACHQNSRRSDQSFITVDCGAIPETLAESTLFGHKKGAFTGADTSQSGLVEQADGGTLFLDEVGELPLAMQKVFLRILQERRFRPVGGKQELKSDFRLISATNRNLDQMVAQGQFRQDLLFRLQAHIIELPPLRNRSDDIKSLILYYLAKLSERYGLETKGFSPDFLEAVLSYPWPGNVRELINTIEVALMASGNEPTLIINHLPVQIRTHLVRKSVEESNQSVPRPSVSLAPQPESHPPTYKAFRESVLRSAEKEYLQNLMTLSKGSVKKACHISGLGRSRLYNLLKKNNVSRSGRESS